MPKSRSHEGLPRQGEHVDAITDGPHADPNRWFTPEEAAEYLNVSARRMRRWIYNGSIGSTALPGGRGRRISGAHLNAAMGLDDE